MLGAQPLVLFKNRKMKIKNSIQNYTLIQVVSDNVYVRMSHQRTFSYFK